MYCIIISAYELSLVHENRGNDVALSDEIIANSKQYTIDEIVSMVEVNDVIEIQIVSKSKTVKIGASSDCKNGSSKFFDKLYYIDDKTFEEIKDFKSELLSYAISGQISVLFIDDIAPR